MQLSVPPSTFSALEQTLRRPFFSPLGLQIKTENDKVSPLQETPSFYVCRSGRIWKEEQEWERRDGRKCLLLFFPSFPLSATILAGWKYAVIEIAFRTNALQFHRHPDSSMAKIQPFFWMHVYS